MELFLFIGICLVLIICAAAVRMPKRKSNADGALQLLTGGIGNLQYEKNEQTVAVERGLYSYLARVRLVCALRGAAAETALRQVNRYNGEAADGKEYLMAMLEVTAEKQTAGDGMIYVSSCDMECRSGNGTRYEHSSVITPAPALRASLREGETVIGWVAFEVERADERVQLVFGQNYNGSGGAVFAAVPSEERR